MRILLVDGMNNLYRAYFAYSRMTNKGKPVSAIYGMPHLLESVIRHKKIDRVIIVWDGQKSEHRLKILPDYKGKRKGVGVDKEDLYRQRDTVMKMLMYLGVPQVWHDEVEADDYIYMLSRKLRKKGEIYILSTDKDFHQLLGNNVKIVNSNMQVILTKKNFEYHFGYSHKQSLDYLIFTGDKSDNIPGYRGIGDKRAKAFLEEHSSIKFFLKSDKEHKGIDREILEEVYKTNRLLIGLKYFYTKFLKGKIPITYHKGKKKPEFKRHKLFRLCDNYNILNHKKPIFLKTFTNILP